MLQRISKTSNLIRRVVSLAMVASLVTLAGANDLKTIYGGQEKAYAVESLTFAVEETYQDYAVGGQLYGANGAYIGFLYYLNSYRQRVDYYFEMTAYEKVLGLSFHPSTGRNMVYGIGKRSGTSKAYELFQVSNQNPHKVDSVKSLRWHMTVSDFTGFHPSPSSPIDFFLVTNITIAHLGEPTDAFYRDYYLYSDNLFNGASERITSGDLIVNQLDTAALAFYISKYTKSTSSGQTGLSYALRFGLENFPEFGATADIPADALSAWTESSIDYATSCLSYKIDKKNYRTAIMYLSYNTNTEELTSQMMFFESVAIASTKMTSATTSLIVAEFPVKDGDEKPTGAIQLQLFDFNFATLTYTKKNSGIDYWPKSGAQKTFLVKWLSNDIIFSGLFAMNNISGLVGQVHTGIDSERSTTMWGAADAAVEYEAMADIAAAANNEEFGEGIAYHDIVGYKYTHKNLRSVNYSLYTYEQDVKLGFAVEVDMAPYVKGSKTIAMVRTKIDNQITVVLPLVRDDDTNDEFYIEARMRHNSKIFFWPKPSSTYKGQFELYSQKLTVSNIELGIHTVDVKFIDKVTGNVGIELSFSVQVLSLADYLRAGLDAQGANGPQFTGSYGCSGDSYSADDGGDDWGDDDWGDGWGDEGESFGDEEGGDEGGEGDYEGEGEEGEEEDWEGEEGEEEEGSGEGSEYEEEEDEEEEEEYVEPEVEVEEDEQEDEDDYEEVEVEVDVSYDEIYDAYMAEKQTVENYLELYGGPVTSKAPKMDSFGKLTFSFSRPIQFPDDLIADYDPTYVDNVPEMEPTDEDIEQIDILYERAYAIAEAKALAEQAKNRVNSSNSKSDSSTSTSSSSADIAVVTDVKVEDLQECLAREGDDEWDDWEEEFGDLDGMMEELDPSSIFIEEIQELVASGVDLSEFFKAEDLLAVGFTEEQIAAAGISRRLLQSQISTFERKPDLNYSLKQRLIVEVIPGDEANDADAKAMKSFSYQLKGASSEGFEIEFSFDSPKLFGAAGTEQFIVVRADFGDFEPGWDSKTELLRYKIPKQTSNDEGTKQAIESLGAVGASSTAATSAALGVNVLLSGAMSQVWGMINGLQIFVHFPLFNLDFPDFSLVIVKKLIQIASFDILPTDPFFDLMSPPDEADPEEEKEEHPSNDVNPGLLLIGYESSYIILNMGTLFVTLLIMGAIPVCLFCTRSCKHKSRWLNKKHESLGPSVRGNMWIRFVMEAFLEIAIAGTVNAYTLLADGELPFDNVFNIINTLTLLILAPACFIFPFWILCFYIKNYSKWEDEDFEAKYGAVFEGLRKDTKSSLIYPFIFSLRRAVLTVVCLLARPYFFLQVLSQLLTSSFMIWYLITYKPFEEPLMLKLDVFNEVTTLAFIYCLLCFSDANPSITDNSMPYDIAFMAFLVGNMGTHLYFLIKDSCINAKEKCKKCKCCRKKNDPAAKYASEDETKKRQRFPQDSATKQLPLEIVVEESEEYGDEDEEEDGDSGSINSQVESDSDKMQEFQQKIPLKARRVKTEGKQGQEIFVDFDPSTYRNAAPHAEFYNDKSQIELKSKAHLGDAKLLGSYRSSNGDGDTTRFRGLADLPGSPKDSAQIESVRGGRVDEFGLAKPAKANPRSHHLDLRKVRKVLKLATQEQALRQQAGNSDILRSSRVTKTTTSGQASQASQQLKQQQQTAQQKQEMTNQERRKLQLKAIDDLLLDDLEEIQ